MALFGRKKEVEEEPEEEEEEPTDEFLKKHIRELTERQLLTLLVLMNYDHVYGVWTFKEEMFNIAKENIVEDDIKC